MDRKRIFQRDGHRCVYCGRQFDADELTVDHVQPRIRGGDHSAGNLVTACKPCNTLKGHRPLGEFLADSEDARKTFFASARHVWSRFLRELERDIESARGRRMKGQATRARRTPP